VRPLLLAGLLVLGSSGPYDIALLSTPAARGATGTASLVFAPSPFGIAVTADGRTSYDVRFQLAGLPEVATLGSGEYRAYVAWVVTTNLGRWQRLGTVRNGMTTVGRAELNKFLLVVTAETDSLASKRSGPTMLHGASPSTWLQSLLSHALFRGIPPG
jgi:hypothetical protein